MEGIENIDIKDIKIANQLNLRIKLLGISEIINGKLFETVHPCLVSKNTYIGNVNGVMNAVITKVNLLVKVFYKVRGRSWTNILFFIIRFISIYREILKNLLVYLQ